MRGGLLFLAIVLCSIGVAGRDLRVPEAYATIQEAVDAASSGDTVDVAPGFYAEDVILLGKTDVTLRGRVDLAVGSDEPCWEAVEQSPRRCVVAGSLAILSSRRVRIEGLTILSNGPCIHVDGTADCPSTDVSVRYCSLIAYAGSAVALGEHHKHVSVSCSNAFLQEETARMIASAGEVPRVDTLLTCARTVSSGWEINLAEGGVPEVVVAVIDSGIDRTLPELSCRIWTNRFEIPGNGVDDDANGYVDDVHGWDFRDGDADSLVGTRLHWHGTAVAALVADAIERHSTPGTPVAVSIMDLRFLDSQGVFYASDWCRLADAIDYAVDNGARIINLSVFATREPPVVVRDAIVRAVERDVLIVAIAGNGAGAIGPIANRSDVLTVGATDVLGNPASFSNVGESLDLVSLGVDVLTLLPGGPLASLSGTSFAAPRIAGVAALQLAQQPALTLSELIDILLRAAIDLGAEGRDTKTGWGLIE